MTKQEAVAIIESEQLEDYNLCEQRYHHENEVGIQNLGVQWIVYATDECASVVTVSEAYFEFEEDAWDNFIHRLRALNRIRMRHGGRFC